MKRLLRLSILCATLMFLLCASVYADNGTGFYNIGKTTNVTVTPDVTEKTDVIWGNDPEAEPTCTLYNGSEKMSVEASGVTDGQQYIVLLTTADSLTGINKDNIFYVDQASASGTKVTFNNVYPKQMASSGERTENATLYIIGSGFSKQVKLSYANNAPFVAPLYTLGDVNVDGKINQNDALLCLQYQVGLADLTPTQQLAANVTKPQSDDTAINQNDALRILQYQVGLITEWDQKI